MLVFWKISRASQMDDLLICANIDHGITKIDVSRTEHDYLMRQKKIKLCLKSYIFRSYQFYKRLVI